MSATDAPHLQQIAQPPEDEGGLRPPPGLSFWRRVWWWFDFLILVKIARLRFVAILVVIGAIITQWDLLVGYYDRWTRPAATAEVAGGGFEWFCPMHPTIIRDNPKDKCPICFMPLSKRKKGEQAAAEPLPAGIVNRVQLSPYRVVLAGVNTWRVDYVSLSREIVVAGIVEFNERGQKTVAARIDGRIDELVVSETGQWVEAGDVLASIYSPNLLVTVQELLRAQKADNAALVRDARRKLELLGIDTPQVDEILRASEANTHLRIRSPISGHVIQKYVREGQYVEQGNPLYELADLSTVWIQAQIYEDDIALLTAQADSSSANFDKVAIIATTRAFPNEEFHGKLSFVYPHVDQATRTLSLRFEIDNPEHKLRPGGTASVRLFIAPQQIQSLAVVGMSAEQKTRLAEGRVIAVPQSAIIDTGDQKVVYRQVSPGVFEGVRVMLGPKMADPSSVAFYPVLSGLAAGDQIVTSGSFLIDAETRLNPAAGSIYYGGSGGSKSVSAGGVIRPTTPEDPEAKAGATAAAEEKKIGVELAKLPPADRAGALAQRFCVTNDTSRLGSMGPPIKLMLSGEPVFLCCEGCEQAAKDDPAATLARARQLRIANESAPASPPATGGRP